MPKIKGTVDRLVEQSVAETPNALKVVAAILCIAWAVFWFPLGWFILPILNVMPGARLADSSIGRAGRGEASRRETGSDPGRRPSGAIPVRAVRDDVGSGLVTSGKPIESPNQSGRCERYQLDTRSTPWNSFSA